MAYSYSSQFFKDKNGKAVSIVISDKGASLFAKKYENDVSSTRIAKGTVYAKNGDYLVVKFEKPVMKEKDGKPFMDKEVRFFELYVGSEKKTISKRL